MTRKGRRTFLRLLAVCVTVLGVLAPTTVWAAPVFAFILGSGGLALLTGTALEVASAILGFAATMAATYFLGQLFMEKPKDPGVRQDVNTGDRIIQSIILGRYATPGNFLYTGSWGESGGGTPNAYLVQVFGLSDIPITAGRKMFVFDEDAEVDLGSTITIQGNNVGNPCNAFMHDGQARMWVKFKIGTQTTVDPYLAAVFGSNDFPIDADFIGRGRAYAIVTTQYMPELFDDFPAPTFEVDGAALYDPREDGTNGGTGSQRYVGGVLTDATFTQNLKIIHYNVLRGIYYDGKRVYGGDALSAYLFDNDLWFAAMTECSRDMDLKEGGTEKQFWGGMELSIDMPVADFTAALDTCCEGRTTESGGVFLTYVGAYGASVYSFTDDDIIVTLDQQSNLEPSVEEMYNVVTGSYVSPEEHWTKKSFPEKKRTAYITEDGGQRREKSIDLPYITSGTRAQRIALGYLKESRRTRKHLLALPFDAFRLNSLDVVSWTSAKNQYTNKKFLCGTIQKFQEGYIVVALREVDMTDHDFEPLTDEDPIINGVLGDRTPATQLIDITVTATAVKKANNSNNDPALKVTWPTGPKYTDAKWVRVQYRLAGLTGADMPIETAPFDDGKILLTKGIKLNEVYDVRAKIVPYSDRITGFCAWVEDVTANVGHNISIEDVEDEAPEEWSAPTAIRRTNVLRDGKVMTLYKITFDDTPANYTYDLRVLNTTDNDADWIHAKGSPKIVELMPLHDYEIQVRAVSRTGIPGDLNATPLTITVPKKTAGDGNVPAPTGVTANGNKAGIIVIKWNDPRDDSLPNGDQMRDFSTAEVRVTDSAGKGPNHADTTVLGFYSGDTARHTGLNGGAARWYFVRFIDTSGNPGDWTPSSAPGKDATTVKLQSGDIGGGEIEHVNLDTDSVETDNISHDDTKNIRTKNLQKGSVTQTKSRVDKNKGSMSGGKTQTVLWKNGKALSLTNESGAVEFITLVGVVGINGKAASGGKGFFPTEGSIVVTGTYKKGTADWKQFFRKKATFKNKYGKIYMEKWGGSMTLDTYEIPGTPKKGEKIQVKIKFEFTRGANSLNVKWYYRDVRPGISCSRR